MAFCWAHFLFNCHLLLGKRSVTAIFFFFQATSSFVKQQDQQKNPFTLNTAHREPSFWRERNSFGYNEIVPGPALDSKGRPQMHLRFPWWKISFSAEKKSLSHFYRTAFWTVTEVGLLLLVQMKLNTQKMKTTQIHLRPWDVFSKAVKNSQSTYLGAKHRSWKQISCGNFSHGIWFS